MLPSLSKTVNFIILTLVVPSVWPSAAAMTTESYLMAVYPTIQNEYASHTVAPQCSMTASPAECAGVGIGLHSVAATATS